MHGFLHLYILYSPALSKSSAGFCLSYLFFTFSSLSSLTSQPDSPSSSPALPHPGSACPAIPCSAFFPAEPSPAPPGRRFCLVLFSIFFLFPLRFLQNFSQTSTIKNKQKYILYKHKSFIMFIDLAFRCRIISFWVSIGFIIFASCSLTRQN